jgi:hypothetical protein
VNSRAVWITWLQVVLAVLLAYALVLVFAGSVAGQIFSTLGFGPPESINSAAVRDYLKLPFMVLGAVLAGWAVMMIHIVRGPLRDGSRWANAVLIRSVALWFVLDTGMSLALGFPTHALFNLLFALALGIPLLRLRSL